MKENARAGFDFYYGKEAEQFNFHIVSKILFTDERFKGMSSDAKLLYEVQGEEYFVENEVGVRSPEKQEY